MNLLGFPKRAEHPEEDITPHLSWRDVYDNYDRSTTIPRKARLALKSPGIFIASELFKNASFAQVASKLASIQEILKEGGEWEQGAGGSAASGVYSMTPQSLGVPGYGLGGQGAFNSIASMQMRPTLASGMYGGWGGPGGGDVAGVVNSYRTMAGGGPVGW